MRWRQAGSRPREVALDEAPEPAARDDEQPNLDEVLTALAALSFNQRAAIVMRELEGRSYQEISGVLGVSVSAVEALLFRARRNLQVRRRALGVLTTVPLPGSLASFIGGGGGAVVAGSAAVGADLVLKAAAVVAVGAATVGVGYKSVQAVTAPRSRRARPRSSRRSRRSTHTARRRTRRPLRRATAIVVTAARSSGASWPRRAASHASRPTGGPSGSLPPAQQTARRAAADAGRGSATAARCCRCRSFRRRLRSTCRRCRRCRRFHRCRHRRRSRRHRRCRPAADQITLRRGARSARFAASFR